MRCAVEAWKQRRAGDGWAARERGGGGESGRDSFFFIAGALAKGSKSCHMSLSNVSGGVADPIIDA